MTNISVTTLTLLTKTSRRECFLMVKKENKKPELHTLFAH